MGIAQEKELLERFARTEATVTSLLELHKKLDQKVDTVLQMQIQIASMQESSKSHAEKIDRLFTNDAEKENRIKLVESRIHWGKGVIAVLFTVILPSTGWILNSVYQQIGAIDRRVLGIEYQIQPKGH